MSRIPPIKCVRCERDLCDEDLARTLDRALCVPCVYAAEAEHRHDAATLPVAAALRRALDATTKGDTWRLMAAFVEELERRQR